MLDTFRKPLRQAYHITSGLCLLSVNAKPQQNPVCPLAIYLCHFIGSTYVITSAPDGTATLPTTDDRKPTFTFVAAANLTSVFTKISRIKDQKYLRLKHRIFLARNYLQSHDPPVHQQREIISHILEQGGESSEIKSIPVASHPRIFTAALESAKSLATAVKGSSASPTAVARNQASTMSDAHFIAHLPELVESYPVLGKAAHYARQFATTFITESLPDTARSATKEIHKLYLEHTRVHYQQRMEQLHGTEDRQRWAMFKDGIRTRLSQLTSYVTYWMIPMTPWV